MKNNRLTKYDDIRQIIIRNIVKNIPKIEKKQMSGDQQTLLTEH